VEGVDCTPSSDTDLVLFDTAAQRIDPSSIGSHSSSTTGFNAATHEVELAAIFVCELFLQ